MSAVQAPGVVLVVASTSNCQPMMISPCRIDRCRGAATRLPAKWHLHGPRCRRELACRDRGLAWIGSRWAGGMSGAGRVILVRVVVRVVLHRAAREGAADCELDTGEGACINTVFTAGDNNAQVSLGRRGLVYLRTVDKANPLEPCGGCFQRSSNNAVISCCDRARL